MRCLQPLKQIGILRDQSLMRIWTLQRFFLVKGADRKGGLPRKSRKLDPLPSRMLRGRTKILKTIPSDVEESKERLPRIVLFLGFLQKFLFRRFQRKGDPELFEKPEFRVTLCMPGTRNLPSCGEFRKSRYSSPVYRRESRFRSNRGKGRTSKSFHGHRKAPQGNHRRSGNIGREHWQHWQGTGKEGCLVLYSF